MGPEHPANRGVTEDAEPHGEVRAGRNVRWNKGSWRSPSASSSPGDADRPISSVIQFFHAISRAHFRSRSLLDSEVGRQDPLWTSRPLWWKASFGDGRRSVPSTTVGIGREISPHRTGGSQRIGSSSSLLLRRLLLLRSAARLLSSFDSGASASPRSAGRAADVRRISDPCGNSSRTGLISAPAAPAAPPSAGPPATRASGTAPAAPCAPPATSVSRTRPDRP